MSTHIGAGTAAPPTFAFPTIGDVRRAAERLRGQARRTPFFRSEALSRIAGVDVHLKLESLQRTGSFKFRGAFNRIAQLTDDERARGLVTASAGNHGQGVALAARVQGVPAVVFVGEHVPQVKRRKIERHGGELRVVPGGWDEAHAAAEAHAAETGALYVHAFSDPGVVAGAGTVGLEIFEELPGVRTLVVPLGGGGLIGGIGTVARATGDGARVIGVQTEETPGMHASLAAGRLVNLTYGPTLCEGLSGDTDEAAVALARRVVDQVVLVTESSVPEAIRWLLEEEGVVAEGSAAVAVAALLTGAAGTIEGPVAAVVSGSNIDAARLARIVGEG